MSGCVPSAAGCSRLGCSPAPPTPPSPAGPGVPWRSGDDPSTWPASAGMEARAAWRGRRGGRWAFGGSPGISRYPRAPSCPPKGLFWQPRIPSLLSFPPRRGWRQARPLDRGGCRDAAGSLRRQAGVSQSPSVAPSPMKRDAVTAQTSVPAFADALCFTLALPGRSLCRGDIPVCHMPRTSPSRREQLRQQRMPTGMATLGPIPCPSPGSHPNIPAEDGAGGIFRRNGGGVMDPKVPKVRCFPMSGAGTPRLRASPGEVLPSPRPAGTTGDV